MLETLDGLERAVVQHALFADMECELEPPKPPPSHPAVTDHEDPPNEKPKRKKSDATHRCFYCDKWRVWDIFQLCWECKRWLREASIGMPRLSSEPKPEKGTLEELEIPEEGENPCS